MWHMTHDTGHMTHDIWCGVNILSKFQLSSSNGLAVMMLWISGGKGSLTDWINYEAVCRTAPATLGLLKTHTVKASCTHFRSVQGFLTIWSWRGRHAGSQDDLPHVPHQCCGHQGGDWRRGGEPQKIFYSVWYQWIIQGCLRLFSSLWPLPLFPCSRTFKSKRLTFF